MEERFEFLFQKYVHRTTSPQEEAEFFDLLKQQPNDNVLEVLYDKYPVKSDAEATVRESSSGEILESILRLRNAATKIDAPVRSIGFVRKWGWTAAAASIVLIVGVYFFFNKKPSTVNCQPLTVNSDIAPGGNKAILTLANGSQIVLDSAHDGQLALQGQTNPEDQIY
jgi:transmembrane sensor